MKGILDRIVETKEQEIEALRPLAAQLRSGAEAAGAPRPFANALRRGDTVSLIAEIKRRSPSAGWIRPDLSVAEIAGQYAAAGAAAVSVLTDIEYFGGALSDLRVARRDIEVPTLRKDFLLDPLQLWEARVAGADAVLLIVRILDDEQLRDLSALAAELGMGVLVEVHTADELERALQADAQVIGVNNRDLSTFVTDLEVVIGLADRVPPDRVLVAESGIRSAEDVDRLGEAGVDAILVGESLMRSPDVAAAASALASRPRVARGAVR